MLALEALEALHTPCCPSRAPKFPYAPKAHRACYGPLPKLRKAPLLVHRALLAQVAHRSTAYAPSDAPQGTLLVGFVTGVRTAPNR